MNKPGFIFRFWNRFGFFAYLAMPQVLLFVLTILGLGRLVDSQGLDSIYATIDHALKEDLAAVQEGFEYHYQRSVRDYNLPDSMEDWFEGVRSHARMVERLVLVVDDDGTILFSDRVLPVRPHLDLARDPNVTFLFADGETSLYRLMAGKQIGNPGPGGNPGVRLVLGKRLDFLLQVNERQNQQLVLFLSMAFAFILMVELILIQGLLTPLRIIADRMKIIGPETLGNLESIDALPKELSQLSERFSQLIGRLRMAFEERKGFTDDLAHQLRTPLTVMKMEIESFLRKSHEPKEYEAMLEEQLDNLHQLNQVIDSLLLISRYESIAQLPDIDRFSLGGVVLDLMDLFEPMAQEMGVDFRTSFDMDVMIRGNDRILRQAVSNIIDNALKYGSEGHYIDLVVDGRDRQARLEIRNYGPPIPPDQMDRIFDRFFRSGLTSSSQGFGLGLAIVRQIINLHGGQVKVSSDEETGTAFTMIFPMADQQKG